MASISAANRPFYGLPRPVLLPAWIKGSSISVESAVQNLIELHRQAVRPDKYRLRRVGRPLHDLSRELRLAERLMTRSCQLTCSYRLLGIGVSAPHPERRSHVLEGQKHPLNQRNVLHYLIKFRPGASVSATSPMGRESMRSMNGSVRELVHACSETRLIAGCLAASIALTLGGCSKEKAKKVSVPPPPPLTVDVVYRDESPECKCAVSREVIISNANYQDVLVHYRTRKTNTTNDVVQVEHKTAVIPRREFRHIGCTDGDYGAVPACIFDYDFVVNQVKTVDALNVEALLRGDAPELDLNACMRRCDSGIGCFNGDAGLRPLVAYFQDLLDEPPHARVITQADIVKGYSISDDICNRAGIEIFEDGSIISSTNDGEASSCVIKAYNMLGLPDIQVTLPPVLKAIDSRFQSPDEPGEIHFIADTSAPALEFVGRHRLLDSVYGGAIQAIGQRTNTEGRKFTVLQTQQGCLDVPAKQ